ncbi:MAG: hypothetical protein WAM28_04870 [Chlamydiales bacterium]
MTGIDRVSHKMKKKISFGDYTLSSEDPNILSKKIQKGRKIYLLTQEDMNTLNKIFAKRLNANHATSIADIMSEAIRLLYRHEEMTA